MIRQGQDARPFTLVGMTQAERKVLLDLVRQEAPALLHPGAVKRIRPGTWDLIMTKFNESTSCSRSVAQLKSCLQNIMRKTLQKKAGACTTQPSYRKINFLIFEKNLILNLGKQRPVVFSKLKDGKTQALKRKAWTEIMWAFNKTPGIKTQRTAREIKNCMVNMTNRNKEVDEFLKSQMPGYAKQTSVAEQPHLEGTVVLAGVPHPVTNVHGNSVAQSPMQSPTDGTMQSSGTKSHKNSQQGQRNNQVAKHRFLLPKPPGLPPSTFANQSTPDLMGTVSQSMQMSLPQNNIPNPAKPVRTLSVPQVSMTSTQLSPSVSTLPAQPSQMPMPHMMQAGPAIQVQSSTGQPVVSVHTSHAQPLPSMPLPPPQDSVLTSSGWIPDNPSPHHQTPSTSKLTGDNGDDCVIEIKEESSSEPEEVFGLEGESSTMEVHQSPIDISPRYGDQLLNPGVNQVKKASPAQSTLPQRAEPSSDKDGLRNVQITVHRDQGGHQNPMEQNQGTSNIASSSFTSALPCEETPNSSGYLIQSSSQFLSQNQLFSHDSSCSTNGLTTDLSTEMQDSGIRLLEPKKDGESFRRSRLKRRKESVGTLRKRLLQQEHDLRVQMMREEHAWMLEEHVWKREEHELRMNMIRINSKF
ncbi:uncharacterized protein LOC121407631 [Lytechinus variegatus]|uniref:uncharacterized protein LOC121407631 n=1 Tax=Lytechinus variegatus TaxID=7654 RepID=UPI001BB1FD4E|nr:uncharacterized protein LOC121407631 [Lytechinus variegatus]XP_041454733.1 uncharacterized protein LOC121407631 [Lytechinus variegatus]